MSDPPHVTEVCGYPRTASRRLLVQREGLSIPFVCVYFFSSLLIDLLIFEIEKQRILVKIGYRAKTCDQEIYVMNINGLEPTFSLNLYILSREETC
jgi:hypothetical protein